MEFNKLALFFKREFRLERYIIIYIYNIFKVYLLNPVDTHRIKIEYLALVIPYNTNTLVHKGPLQT